jgi:hypothetical protein
MAKTSPILSNLNGGEISPQLDARVDTTKYQSGAHRLENFIPRIQGGLQKRSGTRFVKETKDSTQRSVLIPFEFSTTQAYVIELGNQYARFYRNGGAALEPPFTITGITNANPAVVTTSAPHGYSNGDEVFIQGASGMIQVNNRYFKVAGVTATTFQLSGIDSTSYGVFAAGGSATLFATNTYQIDFNASVGDQTTITNGVDDFGAGGKIHRGIYKFNVPAGVPAGVTITGVTITLSVESLDGNPSADSWYLGAYNTTGQGDALSDGFTLAWSRADVSGAPYITTTNFRNVGIYTLTLAGTAVADVQAILNASISGYSVACRQVSEAAPPPNHGVEIASDNFGTSSHRPQLNVTWGSGTPTASRVYTISTPYAAADLDGISYAQSADTLYLAHKSYPPEKFQRLGDANWTAQAINFAWPPFLRENTVVTDYMIASADTGSGITLTSTGGHFNANQVNGFVKLRELVSVQHATWVPVTSYIGAQYAGLIAAANVGLQVGDRLSSNGKVYRVAAQYGAPVRTTGAVAPSHEQGTQSDGTQDWQFINWGAGYAQITSITDAFRATANVIVALPLSCVQLDITIQATTHGNPVTVGAVGHGYETGDVVFIRGVATMTQINNRTFTITVVNANVFTLNNENGSGYSDGTGGIVVRADQPQAAALNADVTRGQRWLWSFSAWSVDQGYPRAVCFFEDRLWWGGSNGVPQGIWGSRTGDYENHNVKSNAAITDEVDGVSVRVQTQDVNVIEWMNPGKDGIAVGTATGEFLFSSGQPNAAITPDSNYVSRHTRTGVRSACPTVRVNNLLLFVQRAGRALYEWLWNWQTDSYWARDLTVYADHIALSSIKKIAWAQEPNRIIWAITATGSLIGFTYVKEQEVEGWHRHPTAGLVESLAVIPHPDGTQDQLWLIVNRTINAVTRRYIEFIEEPWISTFVLSNAFFVDCGNTYSGTPVTTIFGLDYLVGQSVAVLADGISVADGTTASTPLLTVAANGSITLATAASVIQVGLPFSAILETMRIESGAQDGTAQGKRKRIHNLTVRLYQTGKGLFAGPSAALATEAVKLADTKGNPLSSMTLLDGDTVLTPYPGGYEKEGRVALVHSTPVPCTILGIMPQLDTQDR